MRGPVSGTSQALQSSQALELPAHSIFVKIYRFLLAAVFLLSVATWYFTRDVIRAPVRIASGAETGLNHKVVEVIVSRLRTRGIQAEVIPTGGSMTNLSLLQSKRADLVMVKAGTADLSDLEIIAPVFLDVTHLIVRRESGIESIPDLKGKRVSLGREGSGTRQIAETVLRRFGVKKEELQDSEQYFGELLNCKECDAAFASTSFANPDLQRVLATGAFKLIPIPDVEALTVLNPFFRTSRIPAGLYSEVPRIPEQDIDTFASTALLVGTSDTSSALIHAVLTALYDHHLRIAFPTLIPKAEARNWNLTPLHPAAESFYDPYGGIGTLSAFLESLSAIKELFVALIALGFLLWERVKRERAKEQKREIQQQLKRLNSFVEQAIHLEREYLATGTRRDFEKLLRKVIELKLQALEELSHEELRGDRQFSIFLSEITALVSNLQGSIRLAYLSEREDEVVEI